MAFYLGNLLIIDPDVKLEKVELTQAEYDALTTKKDNILYIITDAPNLMLYVNERLSSAEKYILEHTDKIQELELKKASILDIPEGFEVFQISLSPYNNVSGDITQKDVSELTSCAGESIQNLYLYIKLLTPYKEDEDTGTYSSHLYKYFDLSNVILIDTINLDSKLTITKCWFRQDIAADSPVESNGLIIEAISNDNDGDSVTHYQIWWYLGLWSLSTYACYVKKYTEEKQTESKQYLKVMDKVSFNALETKDPEVMYVVKGGGVIEGTFNYKFKTHFVSNGAFDLMDSMHVCGLASFLEEYHAYIDNDGSNSIPLNRTLELYDSTSKVAGTIELTIIDYSYDSTCIPSYGFDLYFDGDTNTSVIQGEAEDKIELKITLY